ncbi:hypothetical protein VTK56DRAFT_5459 [Thermocarpiscus australiensis]
MPHTGSLRLQTCEHSAVVTREIDCRYQQGALTVGSHRGWLLAEVLVPRTNVRREVRYRDVTAFSWTEHRVSV